MAARTLSVLLLLAGGCLTATTTTITTTTTTNPPTALLSPSYISRGSSHGDLLAVLSLTGLANRDSPTLWLNSTATGWINGVPVMWSYPQADSTWLPYLTQTKGIEFELASDARLCTLLGNTAVGAAVKGLVMYDDSVVLDALKWAAVSAAGIYDGLPATAAMVKQHACLQKLPVVFTIPAATTFSTDLAVYAWTAKQLLPLSSTKVLVGACHNWANYTCGWGDPLGTASVDFAVASRALVINLSPDIVAHPEQAAMFATFAAHLQPLGVFSGWAEPESGMVALLSKKDGVVVCGAPNLSFLSALKIDTAKLPHHLSSAATSGLDKTKIYVTFQSNEGDTPKNAYSFRGGNWLLDARGSVPMSWGSAPIIAELFPGLWEYYAKTALPGDQFFGATGGAGYSYPWSLPSPLKYFGKVAELNAKFMPADCWVDVWDGGCPASPVPADAGQNPCMPMYAAFEKATARNPAGKVGGFSQWCGGGCNKTNAKDSPHYVFNDWTDDGTPMFAQPASLWYPDEKGFCNKTDGGNGKRPSAASLAAEIDCIEHILKDVAANNPQRPLFVPAYGVSNYLDVAVAMKSRLGPTGFEIVGAQDFSVLGHAAAPG